MLFPPLVLLFCLPGHALCVCVPLCFQYKGEHLYSNYEMLCAILSIFKLWFVDVTSSSPLPLHTDSGDGSPLDSPVSRPAADVHG